MNETSGLRQYRFENLWDVSLYFLGFCTLLFHVAVFQGYSELLISTLFLILGLFIFKNNNQRLFLISFSINVFVAAMHGLLFYYARGESFSPGADDKHFYLQTMKMLEGKKAMLGNYEMYIYINYGLYSIADFFGLFDHSYLNIAFLNAFIGATIAPCVNTISSKYFSTKYVNLTVYLVLFFPILLSFSGMLLRDIWVAAIFIWVVNIILSPISIFWKIILCLFLGYISFGFRAATGVVTLLFFASYYFYAIKSNWLKFFIGVTLVVVFFAVFYKSISAVQDIVFEKYKGFANKTSSDNSVGMKLAFSTNPLVRGIYFVILLYNPVPPFHGSYVDDIFIGLGAVVWYFIVPGFIFGLFKAMTDEKLKRFAFAFGTSVLVLLLALFTISGSERHKLLIYAPAIFFYVYYLQNYSFAFRTKLMVLYCGGIVLAGLVYAVLKLQLI